MNRSSCNIADIMMTHKILNLEKSGKIRGTCTYIEKWNEQQQQSVFTHKKYPSIALAAKKWRSISTCVLPSIRNHHFIFFTWNQGWEHFVGWFKIADLGLSQLFFSDWILPIFFFFCFTLLSNLLILLEKIFCISKKPK